MILGARVLLTMTLVVGAAAAASTEGEGAWLGVAVVADEDAPGGGVLVAHVLPGGPAQEAGLEPEDLILSVGGREVTRYADLSAALANHQPGERVPVGVVRGGEELVLQVRLGEPQRRALYYLDPERLLPLEREKLNEEALARSLEAMRRAVASQKELSERYRIRWESARPRLRGRDVIPLELWGVELAQLTPELRVHFGAPDEAGFLVSRVAQDGLAGGLGVRVGDVLVQIGERPLGSWGDLLVAAELVRASEEDTPVPLLVARPEGTVLLEIPAEEIRGGAELLPSFPRLVSPEQTRELERRIQELESKILELEETLARERSKGP